MFNKQKFLSFYPNNPNAEKAWDAVQLAFQSQGGICSCCGQNMPTSIVVDPMIMVGAMGTIRIESGRSFTPIRENLNYSPQGLLTTFPKYFTPQQAQQYAYKPEAIANRVYANRMGNGDEASGDGWAKRGANYLMMTGTDNWNYYGYTTENCLTIEKGAESLAKYFKDRKIIEACKAQNWILVRKLVNGGAIGLSEFLKVVNDYLN